jgi:HEAT repeat protein
MAYAFSKSPPSASRSPRSPGGAQTNGAPSAPAGPDEGSGKRAGGGGGARTGADNDAELSDTEFDARLALRLAKVDVRIERSIFEALEGYGATAGQHRAKDCTRFIASAVRLASHENPVVRAAALAALGRVPAAALWTDPFAAAFDDHDPRVRREAVIGRTRQGLGNYARLVLRLSHDDDAGVRAAVAQALGVAGSAEANATLLVLFTDGADDVADAAAVCLGGRITGAPPAAVIEATKSENPRRRVAAARVLGEAHTPQCLAPHAHHADDPAWTVSCESIRGLARFGGDEAEAASARLLALAVDTSRTRSERFEALQALAHTEKTPDLDELLSVATKDADPALRLVAARTLLARADPRSCDALAALLYTEIGPHCDDEDRRFVRSTAFAMLLEAAGPKLKDRAPSTPDDAAGWRRTLPEIEARIRAPDFEYAPAYLPERW